MEQEFLFLFTDHVTEPAIDVDTMVTEEISQSSPDVSRVTNPPLQDEGNTGRIIIIYSRYTAHSEGLSLSVCMRKCMCVCVC